MIGIYKITSPTGSIYIGQSKKIESRISHYRGALCRSQFRIYNSINKHGWGSHVFEVIEECEESILNEREIFYIKLFDTFNTEHGMNLRPGGGNHKLSEDSKRRISIGNKGKKRSEHHSLRMSKLHKGKKLSEEHRQALKKANTGSKRSAEVKMNMSKAQKERTYIASESIRRSISEKAKKRISENGMHPRMINYEGKGESLKKKILDTKTNIVYVGVQEAADFLGLSYGHLKACLRGAKPNKTTLKYL